MKISDKIEVFLFDWGDTLMVDFPGAEGKMCSWDHVEVTPYAENCLKSCAEKGRVYIATGAGESTAEDIRAAFHRVGLEKYISGYFCRVNTGFLKPDPRFYQKILNDLNCSPEKVVMIGDSLEKDILPCLKLGIEGVWLTDEIPEMQRVVEGVRIIKTLNEL